MTDRAYERISLDMERSGSITKQRSQLEEFGGKDIVHYEERSVSGSKVPFAERPQGKRLLEELRAGDRVLFTKIDRAARNVADLLATLKTIDAAGASAVFVEQKIDTSGPFGQFMLVLLAAIAQLEADIIGERRKESLAAFAKEGRHAVGAAPFGFHSVDNPNGRGLVIRPHPEDGPLLKSAIERVLAGEAQAQVVKDLPLKEAGFSVLLRNPRLAGMTPTPTGGVVMIDGVPRIDPEAALLTISEWHTLREHMKRPDRKPWAHQDGYGLALTCSACGMRLYKSINRTNPKYTVYKCGRAKHEVGSQSASVTVDMADPYIEARFLEEHGERPVVVTILSDSEDAKVEAVALAQIQLEAAQEAFLAVSEDDEEEDALDNLREAKRAVRAAREMEIERTYRAAYSGETVAGRWADADDAERCRMLKAAGTWLVHPGKSPVDERIELKPNDLMVELRSYPVGEEEDAPRGFLL